MINQRSVDIVVSALVKEFEFTKEEEQKLRGYIRYIRGEEVEDKDRISSLGPDDTNLGKAIEHYLYVYVDDDDLDYILYAG